MAGKKGRSGRPKGSKNSAPFLPPLLKNCTKCVMTLPAAAFNPRYENENGLRQAYCKRCTRATSKWRLRGRELEKLASAYILQEIAEAEWYAAICKATLAEREKHNEPQSRRQ